MTAPTKTIIRRKPAENFTLFAVCPGGLEPALKEELENFQLVTTAEFPGGIEFQGNLETAYRTCLSLRTASRLLLRLSEFNSIRSPEDFYQCIRSMDWAKVFIPTSTFAVYFTESNSQNKRPENAPQFMALKAKDAIADSFRESLGQRPDVSRDDPDITIRIHLHHQNVKVYLDFSGPSLHERGYRKRTGEAPLKENLAAGLLHLSGWAKNPVLPVYDPFCGSGTLLIEAALIASKTAPGLFRTHYGFLAWRGHQRSTYDRVRDQLEEIRIKDFSDLPKIFGSDVDPSVLDIAFENIERAGFSSWIHLESKDFSETKANQPKGLILMNPPYGVRIGSEENLHGLYQMIGSTLKHRFSGWSAGIISSQLSFFHAVSLKPRKKHKIHNGAIETLFYVYVLF
jgi:23S rRNA (guanine2445-N2)-methyltransferase / 23S rRNA (guanine2069-N7)-methyltransferase